MKNKSRLCKLVKQLVFIPFLVIFISVPASNSIADVSVRKNSAQVVGPVIGTENKVCNGAKEATKLGIMPPAFPSNYSVPPPGTPFTRYVSTTAELQLAVTNSTAGEKIILEPGVYDPAGLDGNYLSIQGQHIIASLMGTAILKFGIEAGGNNGGGNNYEGAQIRGIFFDIDNPIYAAPNPNPASPYTAAIANWGDATFLRLEDNIFRGNGVVERAISIAQPDGLRLHRSTISDFLRFGVIVHNGLNMQQSIPVITDLYIREIGDIEWQMSSDYRPGTQEQGIQLAVPGFVTRVHLRNIWAAGINVGLTSNGSSISHVDVDHIGVGGTAGSGVGVYFEKRTLNTRLHTFCVGPQTRIGVVSEWDLNIESKGVNNLVDRGLIESSQIGVYFDQGTVDSTVSHVTFRNYSWAAVGMFNNLSDEAAWNAYDDGGHVYNNIYQEVESPGVRCNFTRSHHSVAPVCE